MTYKIYYNISNGETGEEIDETILSELMAFTEGARNAFNLDGSSSGLTMWSGIEKHMCLFSKSYPDILFRIDCISEDCERWIEYYKKGLMFIARSELVFDFFSEELLHECDEPRPSNIYITSIRKDIIGKLIAQDLLLVPDAKGRYVTAKGMRTNVGIASIVIGILKNHGFSVD